MDILIFECSKEKLDKFKKKIEWIRILSLIVLVIGLIINIYFLNKLEIVSVQHKLMIFFGITIFVGYVIYNVFYRIPNFNKHIVHRIELSKDEVKLSFSDDRMSSDVCINRSELILKDDFFEFYGNLQKHKLLKIIHLSKSYFVVYDLFNTDFDVKNLKDSLS